MRIAPIALGVLATAAAGLAAAQGSSAGPPVAAAKFDSQGRLLFPDDYREWIYLSSGRGMSYSPMAMAMPEPPFDNVFVNPAAYRGFLERGVWPDDTVLVLEIRGGTSHGSILEGGSFQTEERMAVEVHVKDTPRFGGDGWAFFGFGNKDPVAMIPRAADCYSCHEANAAVDRTFVQFYPTLLPIAREKGTLSPAYLASEASNAAGAK